MAKILILEDEELMGENLSFILESEGYEVEWYKYGEDAVEAAKKKDFDLLLLDIMLSPVSTPLVRYSNGIEVARVIMSLKKIPYIFLTSRSDGISAMQALDQGAEDYIGKPFDIGELLARIRKALKRSYYNIRESQKIEIGDLVIDLDRHEVKKNGSVLNLSRNLYLILVCLVENRGKVVSPKDIIRQVWGNEDTYEDNHIAVNIRRLRNEIGKDYIINKRGIGYVFEEPL